MPKLLAKKRPNSKNILEYMPLRTSRGKSSRKGKNAVKAVTKSIQTTSKKWTSKQSKRWAKGRKARAGIAIAKS